MTQTTKILDGPAEDELNHIQPYETISLLMSDNVSPDMELDENGWVMMHVLSFLWHICNPKCYKGKEKHNLLHLVNLNGYITQNHKRVVVHITNFDVENGHGTIELGQR